MLISFSGWRALMIVDHPRTATVLAVIIMALLFIHVIGYTVEVEGSTASPFIDVVNITFTGDPSAGGETMNSSMSIILDITNGPSTLVAGATLSISLEYENGMIEDLAGPTLDRLLPKAATQETFFDWDPMYSGVVDYKVVVDGLAIGGKEVSDELQGTIVIQDVLLVGVKDVQLSSPFKGKGALGKYPEGKYNITVILDNIGNVPVNQVSMTCRLFDDVGILLDTPRHLIDQPIGPIGVPNSTPFLTAGTYYIDCVVHGHTSVNTSFLVEDIEELSVIDLNLEHLKSYSFIDHVLNATIKNTGNLNLTRNPGELVVANLSIYKGPTEYLNDSKPLDISGLYQPGNETTVEFKKWTLYDEGEYTIRVSTNYTHDIGSMEMVRTIYIINSTNIGLEILTPVAGTYSTEDTFGIEVELSNFDGIEPSTISVEDQDVRMILSREDQVVHDETKNVDVAPDSTVKVDIDITGLFPLQPGEYLLNATFMDQASLLNLTVLEEVGGVNGTITGASEGIAVKVYDGTTLVNETLTVVGGAFDIWDIPVGQCLVQVEDYLYTSTPVDVNVDPFVYSMVNNISLSERPSGRLTVRSNINDATATVGDALSAPMINGSVSFEKVVAGTVSVSVQRPNYSTNTSNVNVNVGGDHLVWLNITELDQPISTDPADGATDVEIDTPITITFESPMDLDSVNTSVDLSRTGVSGQSLITGISTTDDLTFELSHPELVRGAAHELFISSDVVDINGSNPLWKDHVVTFTTKDWDDISISGHITDSAGGPLGGIEVSAGGAQTTSEVTGSFTLVLNIGAYSVDDLIIVADGTSQRYSSSNTDLDLVSGVDVSNIDFTLNELEPGFAMTPYGQGRVHTDMELYIEFTGDVNLSTLGISMSNLSRSSTINSTSSIQLVGPTGVVDMDVISLTNSSITLKPEMELTPDKLYTLTISDSITFINGDKVLARPISVDLYTFFTITCSVGDVPDSLMPESPVELRFSHDVEPSAISASISPTAPAINRSYDNVSFTVSLFYDLAADVDYQITIEPFTHENGSFSGMEINISTKVSTSTQTISILPINGSLDAGSNLLLQGSTRGMPEGTDVEVTVDDRTYHAQVHNNAWSVVVELPDKDGEITVHVVADTPTSPSDTITIELEQSDDGEILPIWVIALIIFIILLTLLIIVYVLIRRGGKEKDDDDDEPISIVECSNCGSLVNALTPDCPECGHGMTLEVFRCYECGASIDIDDEVCPECGSELHVDEPEKTVDEPLFDADGRQIIEPEHRSKVPEDVEEITDDVEPATDGSDPEEDTDEPATDPSEDEEIEPVEEPPSTPKKAKKGRKKGKKRKK